MILLLHPGFARIPAGAAGLGPVTLIRRRWGHLQERF